MVALAVDVRELDFEELDAVSGAEFGCERITQTVKNADGSSTTTTVTRCYGGREGGDSSIPKSNGDQK